MPNPLTAIIAITWRCNSRCMMCDIWKRKSSPDLTLAVLEKLPASLTDIDITGGEPFLHPDIVGVVRTLSKTCPRARLLITTNGLVPQLIKKQIATLLVIKPDLAFRVSLDGLDETHALIRGIPGAFKKATESLRLLQDAGAKDVGIIFTLTSKNGQDLSRIYHYSKENHLAFSLNFLHDSPVYFGEGHIANETLKLKSANDGVMQVIRQQVKSIHPKDWFKAWFNRSQLGYQQTHKRPFPCGAAEDLFYLDPRADMCACHFQPWKLGNLETHTFEAIWASDKRDTWSLKAKQCHSCWMMCTAKSQIKKHAFRIAADFPHLVADVVSST